MVKFRDASEEDITVIIDLLADDPLGMMREDPSLLMHSQYIQTFRKIKSDPNNELIVVTKNEQIIGCMQLTFIPYLTHMGTIRCLIEGVRIHKDFRGQKIGQSAFEWAISYAKTKGCNMIQLTTDKSRPQAIAFYERLGFIASHEGMKLHL